METGEPATGIGDPGMSAKEGESEREPAGERDGGGEDGGGGDDVLLSKLGEPR